MKHIIKLALTAAVLSTAATTGTPLAATELKLSVETPPGHIRNRSAERWAELVAEKSNGDLTIAVFPAAQLYKAADAARALASGALDMSIQANPTLSRFEPNLSVTTMPSFFGTTAEEVKTILDGPLGQELWAMLAKKGIYVPKGGPFLFAPDNTAYTADKPIKSYADLRGVKLAVPPSPSVVVKLKEMGAAPQATPRSEIVIQLSQGQIDGLGSVTDLTISGGKLWEAGIKHAFIDHSGWGFFIPLVSQRTMNKLSDAEKAIIEDAWLETVDWAAAEAARELLEARALNESHGITYVVASDEQITEIKTRLVALQADMAKGSGMDVDFVNRAAAALNAQ
ncbi:MAG: TRAP transporter substrate-binding protein DctP [Qingshengfaniella sp.]